MSGATTITINGDNTNVNHVIFNGAVTNGTATSLGFNIARQGVDFTSASNTFSGTVTSNGGNANLLQYTGAGGTPAVGTIPLADPERRFS